MAPLTMAPDAATDEFLPTTEYEAMTKATPRTYNIVYVNVLGMIYFHIAGFYGLYLCWTSAMTSTVIFNIISLYVTLIGLTAGVHRLWCHKSYKARMPLQIFLMLAFAMAQQFSPIHWARDHRLHHKFVGRDADPQNASRGLFYAHYGWLLVRKHPEVLEKGKTIDVSDLENNPVLRFLHRHKYWFPLFMSLVLPTIIPMYFWGETFTNAWHINNLRYIMALNATFSNNSICHIFGSRPSDTSVPATHSEIISLLTLGEGYHNYHHVFPIDYRSDQITSPINFTTHFIDVCAWLGLAYDLKTVSREVAAARVRRTGDGSHSWAAHD